MNNAFTGALKRRIGFYPGTFDPFTLGHQDIALRALSLVDHLIIGVALSRQKKPMFTLKERCDAIEDAIAASDGLSGRVNAMGFETLTASTAQQQGACVIIRGLRSEADLDQEMSIASFNRHLAPAIETVFLPTRDEHRHISSKAIRELLTFGGDIHAFVPGKVAQRLLG